MSPLRTLTLALGLLAARGVLAQSLEDGPILLPLPQVPVNSSEMQAVPSPFPIPDYQTTSPGDVAPVPPPPTAMQPVSRRVLDISVHGPKAMRTHEKANFAIAIVNRMAAATGPMRITLAIPEHLESLDVDCQKGTLTWPVPPLAPGQKQELRFTAVAKAALPIHLEAIAHVEIAAEHTTQVTEPLLKVTIQAPVDIVLGEKFDAVLTVTNPGSGQLTRGDLKLMPSDGLGIADAPDAPRGPYDLQPGESIRIPLRLTATDDEEQCLVAQAEADGGLTASAKHVFSVHRPRFEVALTGPKAKLVGSSSQYALTVKNAGDAPAKETLAFVEFPKEMQFVSAEAGGIYDPQQHLAYWKLGQMLPGQEQRIIVTTCPKGAGQLECRGSAKDCHGTIAEEYHTTQVKGDASIRLEMQAECPLVKVGDEVRYGFRLTNQGVLAAGNVTITVKAAEGLTVDTEQSKGWTEKEGVWTYETTKDLLAGAQLEILLVYKAETAGGKTVTATVSSPDLAGQVASTDAVRVVELED